MRPTTGGRRKARMGGVSADAYRPWRRARSLAFQRRADTAHPSRSREPPSPAREEGD